MIRGLSIALMVLANAAYAQAPVPGSKLGTTLEEVTTALETDGYELADVLQRHSLVRLIALRDGERHEIRVSMRSGDVLSHKVLSNSSGATPNLGKQPVQQTVATPSAANAVVIPDMPANLSDLLAKEGYRLIRAEQEGGVIEAYAMRDNRMWEVYVDAATGKILRAEMDD